MKLISKIVGNYGREDNTIQVNREPFEDIKLNSSFIRVVDEDDNCEIMLIIESIINTYTYTLYVIRDHFSGKFIDTYKGLKYIKNPKKVWFDKLKDGMEVRYIGRP